MPIVQVISLAASVPRGAELTATNYTAYAGNDLILEILVTDAGGQPLDLTGCTIAYHLRQITGGGSELSGFPKTAVLSPNPDGVGKCTVTLLASVTASLSGTFSHPLVITDPSDTPSKVTTVMVGQATFKTGGI